MLYHFSLFTPLDEENVLVCVLQLGSRLLAGRLGYHVIVYVGVIRSGCVHFFNGVRQDLQILLKT